MADADTHARDECYADWCTLQADTALRGSASRHTTTATSWQLWQTFCTSLGLHAECLPTGDPIPLLQVFAQRYRTGFLAPCGRLVRARTVEDALREVGLTYTRMGAPDPRLNVFGKMDYRLTLMIRAWKTTDDRTSVSSHSHSLSWHLYAIMPHWKTLR